MRVSSIRSHLVPLSQATSQSLRRPIQISLTVRIDHLAVYLPVKLPAKARPVRWRRSHGEDRPPPAILRARYGPPHLCEARKRHDPL